MMECGEKQKIFIVAINEIGKAYPKEIYIDDDINPVAHLENNCIEYLEWSYRYEQMVRMSRLINDGLLGRVMKCKQCGKHYALTLADIAWYEENGLDAPRRCKACRKKNRERDYLFN